MIINHVGFCDGIDDIVAEQFTQSLHLFDPGVVGKQPIVTDAMETWRQHMDEKAPDELGRGQGHDFVTITPLGAIDFPLKGDTAFIAGNEPAVADGDPMGVTRQVSEHGLGSGERSLGIDDPFGPA